MYGAKFQDFTHLVGNNDQPSDKVLMALKVALTEPDRQISNIDVQIHLLEVRIRELRQNRLEIEHSMAPYRRILSPMRRVPADILCTIFRHCLATHRNPTMAASEAPMLLTRVCSRWRTIALASPRLWARIHIPFRAEREWINEDQDQLVPVQSFLPAESLQTVSLILQTRCKAIHEWLLRSRDCPLSISIFYGSKMYSAGPETLCRPTMNLLETIVLFISRWKSLELNVPFGVYAKLESMVMNAGTAALSNLVQVRIAVLSYPIHAIHDFGLIGTLKSPALQRISLSLPHTKNNFLDILDVKSLPWSNLTHFSNYSHSTAHDIFTIFKYCPRLIHTSFILGDEPGFDSIRIEGTVHLPFLVSLWIVETAPPSSATDNLYRSIHAPSIRWIQHVDRSTDPLSTVIMPASHHHEGQSILPLVENSLAGIRTLELDLFHFRPDTVRRMMEAPSVTCSLSKLYLYSNFRYYMAVPDYVESFDLSDLIVQKSADSHGGVRTLLPRLNDFTLYNTRASDNTAFEFITSRIDPTSPTVHVLKKVKIVFERPQDKSKMDLEEEVRKRAAAAGVEIDLTIAYNLGSSESVFQNSVDPLSPSVVTYSGNYRKDDIADCTSWQFEDLTQKFVVDDNDT